MREMRPYGSVRGVPGDRHPYRDSVPPVPTLMRKAPGRYWILGRPELRAPRRSRPLEQSLQSPLSRGHRVPLGIRTRVASPWSDPAARPKSAINGCQRMNNGAVVYEAKKACLRS